MGIETEGRGNQGQKSLLFFFFFFFFDKPKKIGLEGSEGVGPTLRHSTCLITHCPSHLKVG